MTGLEIALIIIAVIIFVGSFFVSEKLSNKEVDEIKKASESSLNRIMEKEVERVEGEISENMDVAVEEAVVRARDTFASLVSEKQNDIDVYSANVLGEINKQHEEITFLYGMLKDKEDELKSMSANVEKSKQSIKELMAEIETLKKELEESETARKKEAEQAIAELKPVTDEIPVVPKKRGRPSKKELERREQEKLDALLKSVTDKEAAETEKGADGVPEVKKAEETKVPSAEVKKEAEEPKKPLTAKDEQKERILALFAEGKTDKEIAKELKMGVGEVRLITELYK